MPTLLEDSLGLVGHSPRMAEVRRLIKKIGRTRAPVLLLGESGTGKEVVARAIHKVNLAGQFVPIDCSLLGTLLETELFGHTRGAFTGAIAHKRGLIALAEGGTAFFDEIGECPLDTQAKLLRVLQEKEFRPVGAVERQKADFRVIAATNRDLACEVERGTFRRDLYYRLDVVKLRLPALRDRKEDIPELATHFLKQYGTRHELSADLLGKLVKYDWPGNVRELENCIRRMVAINSGPILSTADLPTALAAEGVDREFGLPQQVAPLAEEPMTVLRLDEMERKAIAHALHFTGGDRSRTAELLGIGRTTLYRKLREFKLHREPG